MINKKFGDPALPFNLSEGKTDNILNSEIKDHEGIWFIENPVSKELTKRITIKLGPKAEQEFVVVLKAPNTRRSTNLLSMISLSLLTYADEQFGITRTFEQFLKDQFRSSMKDFLKDRKKLAIDQSMEILLAGRIEIPLLVCQRGLLSDTGSDKSVVIPVVVKMDQTA